METDILPKNINVGFVIIDTETTGRVCGRVRQSVRCNRSPKWILTEKQFNIYAKAKKIIQRQKLNIK